MKSRNVSNLTKIKLVGFVLFLAILVLAPPGLGQPGSEPTEPVQGNATRAESGVHTVFAEDFTAEWCFYCPSASKALLDIYNSNDYNFYFVCMITEDAQQNTISDDAAARAEEYNLPGYPTVEFDGGYYEISGSQSDESNYREAIETCRDRNPPDIDIELSATHNGEAVIGIEVEVTNFEDSEYSGILRVYIVEIVSRYFDYDGNHYPYGFLDYAIEKTISIPAEGQSTKESTTWDGAQFTDGLGNDFSDIDPNNMIVMATMSNSGVAPISQRKPYSSRTIGLHWIDEAAAAYLTDKPPDDDQSPEVTITAPDNHEEVSGTIQIAATVNDDGAITKVESKIDDQNVWTPMYHDPTSDEYYRFWDTEYISDGEHTITVRAIDSGNNQGDDSITITVVNDFEEPVIEFKKLDDGDEISDIYELSVEVTDDSGIENVRYRIDSGSWEDMNFEGFSKYTIEIDTTELSNGEHTISIEAEDLSGKVITESIDVRVSNIESSTDDKPKSSIPGFEAVLLIGIMAVFIFSASKFRKQK